MGETVRTLYTMPEYTNDQAHQLRLLAAEKYKLSSVALAKPRTIVVTSGKGGVGKTSFASNLSIVLAGLQKHILLVDADTNLGNVEMMLSVTPKYRLSNVLKRECAVEDALIDSYNGLKIIAGDSGKVNYPESSELMMQRFLESVNTAELSTDIVFIDTSAGLTEEVLFYATRADDTIIVTTPEPTAVMDAYAMMKLIQHRTRGQVPAIHVVVNMVKNPREADETFRNLQSVIDHFLHQQISYLGYIMSTPEVSTAVRKQKPFVISAPHSSASLSVKAIAQKLLNE